MAKTGDGYNFAAAERKKNPDSNILTAQGKYFFTFSMLYDLVTQK
jgi:hypothetical protein